MRRLFQFALAPEAANKQGSTRLLTLVCPVLEPSLKRLPSRRHAFIPKCCALIRAQNSGNA